jgi:hypothetical protein
VTDASLAHKVPAHNCRAIELSILAAGSDIRTMPRTTRIILNLRGGLANQLFQWSCARLLQEEFESRLEVDVRNVSRGSDRGDQLTPLGLIEGARAYGPLSAIVWDRLEAATSPRVYAHINKRMAHSSDAVAVGNYASARALLSVETSIEMKGYFEEIEILSNRREDVVGSIRAALASRARNPLPSVPYAALHVRRGDYIENAQVAAQFGPCTDEYYLKVIEFFGVDRIYVATDDLSWVETHLQPRTSVNLVTDPCRNLWDDLWLLANSARIGMSNSTFSWWGTFLGHAELVAAPEPWDSSGRTEFYKQDWTLFPKNNEASKGPRA